MPVEDQGGDLEAVSRARRGLLQHPAAADPHLSGGRFARRPRHVLLALRPAAVHRSRRRGLPSQLPRQLPQGRGRSRHHPPLRARPGQRVPEHPGRGRRQQRHPDARHADQGRRFGHLPGRARHLPHPHRLLGGPGLRGHRRHHVDAAQDRAARSRLEGTKRRERGSADHPGGRGLWRRRGRGRCRRARARHRPRRLADRRHVRHRPRRPLRDAVPVEHAGDQLVLVPQARRAVLLDPRAADPDLLAGRLARHPRHVLLAVRHRRVRAPRRRGLPPELPRQLPQGGGGDRHFARSGAGSGEPVPEHPGLGRRDSSCRGRCRPRPAIR